MSNLIVILQPFTCICGIKCNGFSVEIAEELVGMAKIIRPAGTRP